MQVDVQVSAAFLCSGIAVNGKTLGMSVRIATDQNLLLLTGRAVLVMQHSCLTLHCQQL